MDKQKKIIIYSGGKTGSTTLLKSFCGKYVTYKIHSFNEMKYTHEQLINYNKFKSVQEFILFDKSMFDNIYVIDSYRNHIERTISSFFNNYYSNVFFPLDQITIDNIYMLIYYINKFYFNVEKYNPLDEELPIFKNYNYDFENDYIKFESENITYIKLRFNSINKWENILTNILKIDVQLNNENLSKNKNYYNKYKLLLENYVISEELFTSVIEDPIFNKYNSEIEKKNYKDTYKIINNYDEFINEKLKNYEFKLCISKENLNKEQYFSNYNLFGDFNDFDMIIHYELIGFYNLQ